MSGERDNAQLGVGLNNFINIIHSHVSCVCTAETAQLLRLARHTALTTPANLTSSFPREIAGRFLAGKPKPAEQLPTHGPVGGHCPWALPLLLHLLPFYKSPAAKITLQ